MTQPANESTQAMLGVNTNTNEKQDRYPGMVPAFYEEDVIPLTRKHLDPMLSKYKIPKTDRNGKIKGPSKAQVIFFQQAMQKTGLTVNIAGKYVKNKEAFFIFCAQASLLNIALEIREMNWYPEEPRKASDVN